MSVEAPVHPAYTEQVLIGSAESLPADFFDGTVAVSRGIVGNPETGYGTLVDIMSEGYTIQKRPEPIATVFTPGLSPEDVLESILGSPNGDNGDGGFQGSRFEPYDRHMQDAGEDSTLAKGITLVSEQGVVRPVLAESDMPESADRQMGRGKNLLLAFRRSKAGRAVAVTALAAGELLSFGSSSAHATTPQECVQDILQKPTITKVGIRHAGQVGGNHNQMVFLNANYVALPADCGDYHRGNAAKAQFLHNGRWVNPTDHGWRGLGGGYDDQGNFVIDPSTAFTGEYSDTAGIHDPPWYLQPCHVRILLKENATQPGQNNSAGSGSQPPSTGNNIAHKTYKINIPASDIYPHSFGKHNC